MDFLKNASWIMTTAGLLAWFSGSEAVMVMGAFTLSAIFITGSMIIQELKP